MARPGLWAQRAFLVRKAKQDLRVNRELPAQRAQPARPGPRDRKVQPAPQERLAHRDQLDRKVQPAKRAQQDRPVKREQLVLKVHQGALVRTRRSSTPRRSHRSRSIKPLPCHSTTTAFASGVSIVDGTKITFAVSGKFDIQFSTQIQKEDTGNDFVSVWLAKNGANVSWTNTDVLITGRDDTSRHVVAWNFFVEAVVGDQFQLMMSSTTSTRMSIVSVGAQTSPDRPEIPGTILTVNQVG
jgi:hypothetical protein